MTVLVVLLGWTLVSIPLAAAVGRLMAGPTGPARVDVWSPAESSQPASGAVVQ